MTCKPLTKIHNLGVTGDSRRWRSPIIHGSSVASIMSSHLTVIYSSIYHIYTYISYIFIHHLFLVPSLAPPTLAWALLDWWSCWPLPRRHSRMLGRRALELERRYSAAWQVYRR